MVDATLTDAVLLALRPAGVREAIRLRLGGGYTAMQVVERIPGVATTDLVAARAEVERVRQALLALAAEGRVIRTRSTFAAELKSKGYRGVVVDVFRLA